MDNFSAEDLVDESSFRDIKTERKKCERIFLSSAMISADMVPYQGIAGDQVCTCIDQQFPK